MAAASTAIYAKVYSTASYVVVSSLVEEPVEITWANSPAGMRDKNLKEPFRERIIKRGDVDFYFLPFWHLDNPFTPTKREFNKSFIIAML